MKYASSMHRLCSPCPCYCVNRHDHPRTQQSRGYFRINRTAPDEHASYTLTSANFIREDKWAGGGNNSQSRCMTSRLCVQFPLQSNSSLAEALARPFFGSVPYGFGMPETGYGVGCASSDNVQLIRKKR